MIFLGSLTLLSGLYFYDWANLQVRDAPTRPLNWSKSINVAKMHNKFMFMMSDSHGRVYVFNDSYDWVMMMSMLMHEILISCYD